MSELNKIQQKLIKILQVLMPSYEVDFWQNDVELFGALPELDSMTIVTLIGEIEDKFDTEIDDEDITEDNFLTVESLTNFLENKLV